MVNATDKWGFTPLHEAAQKGRTQLCALLLAHGSDPTLKNQEGKHFNSRNVFKFVSRNLFDITGQTPLDLASADDVKCLLQDAMPTTLTLPTTTKPVIQTQSLRPTNPGSGADHGATSSNSNNPTITGKINLFKCDFNDNY